MPVMLDSQNFDYVRHMFVTIIIVILFDYSFVSFVHINFLFNVPATISSLLQLLSMLSLLVVVYGIHFEFALLLFCSSCIFFYLLNFFIFCDYFAQLAGRAQIFENYLGATERAEIHKSIKKVKRVLALTRHTFQFAKR